MTLAAQGQAETHPGATLRTLTTVGAIHSMTSREAARGYPVHLRAVVTYYDPCLDRPGHPVIMITDSTATVFVSDFVDTRSLQIKTGDVVQVTGVSGPGEFAPVILQPSLLIVGHGRLPGRARRTTLYQLLKGADDPDWVEMEGIVERVETMGGNVSLKLGLADGELAATTVSERGVNYSGLVDALVRIRGVSASIFNLHRQISGDQFLFPGMASVTVERAAPVDPFKLPISGVSSLMTYAPGKIFNHRVHIRGAVTLLWPGRLLCVDDTSGSICAITAQTTPLAPGDMVDIAGFAQIGQIAPILADAVYRLLPYHHIVASTTIDGSEGLSGEHDAQLVQIEGRLTTQDRALKDLTILVSAGRFTFPVSLPRSPQSRMLLNLREGSLVRITGICAVQTDPSVYFHHEGHAKIKFFQIFLRSSADVVVLQQPSWWTAAHSLRVLEFALAVTLCILGWSIYLRGRLRQQAELLRLQATHDGLTGVWNRKAICDLLRRESEIAGRARKQVGIIMLDADHFKRVNDTYGHAAGDAVLLELVTRIQLAVRSFDLTGRYGGEEFLIVLPNCTSEQVELCAERVRASVAEHPIDAGGYRLAVTVSLGTAVLDPLCNTEQDALAAADWALYRAKHSGRNRVIAAPTTSLMTSEVLLECSRSSIEV
jgi:diguanylate cyclase (GGDEF)-like protein